MNALSRIQASGFTGRHGHPCLYDCLEAVCNVARPRSYLEIGVYDGASLATVLGNTELEHIALCDLWGEDWLTWQGGINATAGSTDHIKALLSRMGYRGTVQFLVGDSVDMLPTLKGQFDLITIDGAHDPEHAASDWNHAKRLLAPGGTIVFDDIEFTEIRRVYAAVLEIPGVTQYLRFADGRSAAAALRFS